MNFRTVAEIENDIANKQMELDQTTHEIQRSILVNAIIDLENEKKAAQEVLDNQQAHLGRVQEAAAESESFLADIDIAGIPVAESGLSPLAFGILSAKVQAKHVAAIEKLSIAMNDMQAKLQQDLKIVTDRANEADKTIDSLTLDNASLDNKVRKGAELLQEATTTIDEQKAIIDEYKKNELLGAPQKPVLTTSEQVAQQEAELKASQIPVTYMAVDPNDFSKKTWNIITVIPEEARDIHYFEKGLYRLVTAEEAEQLRAEYAKNKAAIEEQNESIPFVAEPTVIPVNSVTGQENAPQEETFQGDQVPTSNGQSMDLGSSESDRESDEKESEVDNAPVSKTEFNRLVSYVNHLSGRVQALDGAEVGIVMSEVA